MSMCFNTVQYLLGCFTPNLASNQVIHAKGSCHRLYSDWAIVSGIPTVQLDKVPQPDHKFLLEGEPPNHPKDTSPPETCSQNLYTMYQPLRVVGLSTASFFVQFRMFSHGSHHPPQKKVHRRVSAVADSLGLRESDDLRQHDLRIHGAGYLHQRPYGGLEQRSQISGEA